MARGEGQQRRRERWFADGAAALRRTLSASGMEDLLPDGEFYACPLCLMTYGREAFEHGVFSDEHVPPHSTGGRALVLTCTRCNNTAGTAMDADASAREAVHDFIAGRSPGRALRAEYKIGEVTVQGTMTSENGAVIMNVVPKANNPKDVEAMTETLTTWAGAGAGGSIGFRFRERLSPTAASLSWVRAGYLTAFAALGWRYAFLECLNPLRAQLAAPEEDILPPLSFFDPAAASGRRQLLIVEEPAEMRSLAVVLGRHTVFLPWVAEPKSMDEIAAGLAWYSALPASRRRCTRKQIPWPAEPQYILDQ
jgi:HNH endonuclease